MLKAKAINLVLGYVGKHFEGILSSSWTDTFYIHCNSCDFSKST